jgi:hypothetical protein
MVAVKVSFQGPSPIRDGKTRARIDLQQPDCAAVAAVRFPPVSININTIYRMPLPFPLKRSLPFAAPSQQKVCCVGSEDMAHPIEGGPDRRYVVNGPGRLPSNAPSSVEFNLQ